MECNYDGGDCCGDNVNRQYCSECQCLEGGTTVDSGTTADPETTDSSIGGSTSSSGIMHKSSCHRSTRGS